LRCDYFEVEHYLCLSLISDVSVFTALSHSSRNMSAGLASSRRSSNNVTQTIHAEAARQPEPASALVLSLRERPQITWTEDTIDNEHMGKKSSKRCCIFHKVKKFAESDSDESSDEDTSGGDGNGAGGEGSEAEAGPPGKPKKVKNYQRHHA